ncbi:bis-aminopropyl spermidine synthase family protein [bacterium]|nr:bis-aminopropyl spermidine synthase family protein [bacterium]
MREAGMRLSGGRELAATLGLSGAALDPRCASCDGTGIALPEVWKELIDDLAPAFQRRPSVDPALDQSHGTLETALRRAAYLLSQGLLLGKRLLVLGDDDFTSLAAAALAGKVAPTQTSLTSIQVLEIDERYLSLLREDAERRGLSLETQLYDAREPLPDALHRRADVFITDPPYTLEGLSLFLSRGLHGLDRSQTRDVLLSYPQRPPIQNWELQYAMLELGLSILRVFPGFNRYHGAAMHANVSTLYHLQVTPAASPLHQGKWKHAIYTGEHRPATRYRCKGCRHEVRVGRDGEFTTVRDLKSAGCPECGGRVFLRVGK